MRKGFVMSQAKNNYLLEIGTEELPPGFMAQLPDLLKTNLGNLLTQADLVFDEITVYLTPRRMALIVSGLPAQQPTQQVLHKGPPVRIAFDDKGKPTKATEAFAAKLGVTVDHLSREASGKEECLAYLQTGDGKPTTDVLTDIVPELIFSLAGPRFMQWGLVHDGKLLRFPRPIRWLVSLWNGAHLPLILGDMTSGTLSYGHRFLSKGPVSIQSHETYAAQLEADGSVMVDPIRRKELIQAALASKAKSLGGVIPPNDDLLEEVNQLVEWPWVLEGEIDAKYLDIPKPVIITAMASHQRYFPVETQDGELLPYFLTIANGHPDAADNIRKGNLRVLSARLEDARFFYKEDTKTKLIDRLENLKGVMFQKGLGTLYDKTQRLKLLTGSIADALGYTEAEKKQCQQAAERSKCDLTTSMVFEFTELQGEIGREYALKEGIPLQVADAIFEQYLPRGQNDAIAASKAGVALSLADKLDTLVTVFSQQKAKIPTGSKDPLALRRAVNGILLTVLHNNLTFNLVSAIDTAYQWAPQSEDDDKVALPVLHERLLEFMSQRLKGLLLDEAIPYDVIDAVLAVGNPFEDLGKTCLRARVLHQLTQRPGDFQRLYEPANRISKILGKNVNANAGLTDVKSHLLLEPAEQQLFQALQIKTAMVTSTPVTDNDFSALSAELASLQPAISQFFDDVMVNAPDADVRQNRYNLLSVLHRAYCQWGLFTQLVVDGELQPATVQ